MTEIILPTVQALDPTLTAVRDHDGQLLVTKDYHEARIADLQLLHRADLDWARKTAAAHGLDLDELAAADPNYRKEFRA